MAKHPKTRSSKARPKAERVEPGVARPCTVLHLSDIHRTDDEPVSNDQILHPLVADLERLVASETIEKIDIILVTGDLTQRAAAEEYQEATEFLTGLGSHLSVPQRQFVLLPGNHDVSWDICEDQFKYRKTRPSTKGAIHFPTGDGSGGHLVAESETIYQKRFSNFRDFFYGVTGLAYPTERKSQFTIHEFPEFNVAFACFNSCDEVDHVRFRGSIHTAAIASAADRLSTFSGVRIAAWHHDLDWLHESHADCLTVESLRTLSERTFNLGLCGHTHRPAQHDAWHMSGIPMPILAAGSLCAGARQRRESLGRSYQVLELFGNKVHVHVRTKEDQSKPWAPLFFESDSTASPLRYREIELNQRAGTIKGSTRSGPALRARPSGSVKLPSPFASNSARDANPRDVLGQYVWTDLANKIDCDSPPQIILGPRGSGKTALLLTLTPNGRRISPRYRHKRAEIYSRIGLFCGLNVDIVTAFNGKGWIEREDRVEIFKATLATLVAARMIESIQQVTSCPEPGIDAPLESEVCRRLSPLWTRGVPWPSYREGLEWIEGLRNSALAIIRARQPSRREELFDEISHHGLFGGWHALEAAAHALADFPFFSSTKWWMLFDEVEYLNEWQQGVVYSALSHRSAHLGTKLATLPYAHARAIHSMDQKLSPVHDFEEVVLQFPADMAEDDDSGSCPSFRTIALSLWQNRLQAAGLSTIPIQEAWPALPLEAVASGDIASSEARAVLEDKLIEMLAPNTRTRAQNLREGSPDKFESQFWRKYSRPFRHRLDRDRAKQRQSRIPLVWGWREMIKVCDGNYRWFLQLADDCWMRYWESCGIRPLSPDEQYTSVTNIVGAIYRICGSLTECGPELVETIDRVSDELRSKVYGSRWLKAEQLKASLSLLPPEKANAITVGIAFGYLVPELDENVRGQIVYPQGDAVLRLGFPIAAHKEVPLRAGASVTVDLRQARFPWLKT